MNKIYQLFDEKFVKELFTKKVLPLYPEFDKIKSIKIIPHKKGIWGKYYYHVVIEFKTVFITKEGKIKELPIFCSAHDSEPRKNVHAVLKYLWENSFSKGHLSIPHPLFYSNEFRATFYRGVKGHTLYYYIKEDDRKNVEEILPKVASWFAKLHNLNTEGARNFNKNNSRIKTVVPGEKKLFEKIFYQYPKYLYIYEKAYAIFIKKENKYLNNPNNKHCLVHGDAHPENIIKMGKKKIGVIDFADMSLSDPARDIGSFLQQLFYMSKRKTNDRRYGNKLKKIFLDAYLKNAKIKMTESLEERIEMYYNWTSLRTATHLLLMDHPQPQRADMLIKEVKRKLKITKKS
ncbi:MAG: aminoglycoside phosphotransferase family protein [Patescibacteria group bacterium]|jgi:thiamine kinase-like enzyme|nr:aminoglycoside phosphotransferase family protein [Patescibacteria group bacterium]